MKNNNKFKCAKCGRETEIIDIPHKISRLIKSPDEILCIKHILMQLILTIGVVMKIIEPELPGLIKYYEIDLPAMKQYREKLLDDYAEEIKKIKAEENTKKAH